MRSASMSRVMPALLTRMSTGLGRRHQGVGGRRVGDVAGDDLAPLAQLGGQLVQRLAPAAGQDDVAALGVQRRGRWRRRCRPRRR